MAQDGAGEDDRGEIGFEGQRLADLLHDDHGLDRPAAEAALRLVEGQGEQPGLGIFGPDRAVESFGKFRIGLALFEIGVAAGEKLADTVAQQALFFGKIEIHCLVLRTPGSPWR
ncbi:hypothetical protein Apmu_0001_16 [Acidiphilium multivorum AIU301]|nr:hypothetical protein Apmu_0001_16 [Acidiphilium multivorum AIU301]